MFSAAIYRKIAKYLLAFSFTLFVVWYSISVQDSYLRAVYNSPDSACYYNNKGPLSKDGYIAHGGGVGEFLYTNSEEAVYDSLKRGFQFIELDIIETDDGHLLAAHDRDYFCKLTGLPPGSPLISEEIRKLKIDGKYTVMLGCDILRIMQEHPEMVLVTDKITNYQLLMEEIPLPERIIIECFSPRGVVQAKKCGFIHTAYSLFTPPQLHHAIRYGMKLLIMSGGLVFEEPGVIKQVLQLHQKGSCVMVYGAYCDRPSFIYEYLGKSLSKFYMGRYAPELLPPLPDISSSGETAVPPNASQGDE